MKTITAQQLTEILHQNERLLPLILDVRELNEVQLCMLPNAVHIPMNQIPIRQNELPDGQDIVVYCHHGARSQQVVHYLVEVGFDADNLYNLTGGIDAWALDIDPSMIRY